MTTLSPYSRKHKVCVIGSGNWGSTIAKVVAENTAGHPTLFEETVQMWVYEETVQLDQKSKFYDASSEWSTRPQKLTEVINQYHENVKYLPGISLPRNVHANPSVTDAVKDCTILIFNLPHQFIDGICERLRGHILPYARGISCIKGINVKESSVSLFSESIGHELNIYCGALSGANIANEVAQEKFCETTIAYDPPPMDSQHPTPATSANASPSSSQVNLTQMPHKDSSGKASKSKLSPLPPEYRPIDHQTIKALFHRRYFQVRMVSDVAGVSLGGALKNIVAVAAGWVDGLGWGDNAKAAIMRVGLLEMVDFGKRFFSETVRTATFTEESAGVADLITTCAGGRHHRCAKMSIQEGKSIEEIEERELNGQKLQGTLTAIEVNTFLKSQGLEQEFPLFTAVYNILKGNAQAQDLPGLIEPHDEWITHDNSETDSTSGSQTAIPPDDSVKDAVTASTSASLPHTHVEINPTSPSVSSAPSFFIPAPTLASSRYSRQLLIPSISIRGQDLITKTKMLIVGLGGLGCPAAFYAAGAGFHTIGLVDGDVVELSNLHRQILHSENRVGWTKVASAAHALKRLNSEVRYICYKTRLDPQNALKIIGDYDIILDCTDNPATRYLINDACVILGKPLISGAAQRTEGQLMILNYPVGDGPCYRCIFPKPPSPEVVLSCSEIGILGPVVGVIGVLMAGEAIRMAAEGATPRQGYKSSLLLYNGWSTDTRGLLRIVGLRSKRKDCIACGEKMPEDNTRITEQTLKEGKIDYQAFCGATEDVTLLGPEERISANVFHRKMQNEDERHEALIIDVREEHEVELGPKVRGSINIPMSRILRSVPGSDGNQGEGFWSDVLSESNEANPSQPVFFLCQRGNDSQIAAKNLINCRQGGRQRWIGDVVGGFTAIEKEVAKCSGGWKKATL